MIRLANRLLVLLVGAALLVGGVVVVVEGAWTWTNSGFVVIDGSSWLSSFETTPWSAPIVIAISIGVAALGLALLLLQLKPHPKRLVDFRTDGDAEWVLLRRSTEQHLQRRIRTKVPVSPVKVRLSPRAARWALKVRAKAAASTRPTLEQAGREELEALHAPKLVKVKVSTSGASGKSS